MKIFYAFFILILATACTAKIPTKNNEEKNLLNCDNELKFILKNNLNLSNIKNQDISFDVVDNNTKEEILQIFVSSDGVNEGAVLGSIKINKNERKIYDITDDESNKKPMYLGKNNVFFKECIK